MIYPKPQEREELLALLQELQYSDERYRIAASQSSEIILDYTVADDTMYHVTDRVTAIYGVPQTIVHAPEYLVRCGAVQPESAHEFLELFRRVRAGEKQVSCVLKTCTTSGDIRWDEISMITLFDDAGQPTRAVGVLKDITLQRRAELLYETEVQYRDAMTKEALLHYEADLTNHRMISGLETVLQKFGLPHTDSYEDAVEILISRLTHPDDRAALRVTFSAAHLFAQHAAGIDRIESEYRRVDADDQCYWVRGTAYLFEEANTGVLRVYYYVNDINDEKLKALKLQAQAERDLLTGLYNKGTAERLIRDSIDRSRASKQINAFLIVDLDDFKNINDQLGHAFGDAVLSETARRLQGICRVDDIAGRIGGDEFVLFLKNLPHMEIACRKAQEICEMFHAGIAEGPKNRHVSGTVGVAVQPAHGASFEELYEHADLALYEAKRRGKDAWQLYSEELQNTERIELPRAKIESSAGKLFAENIIEYIFRILYESRDLELAINGVLELVSTHFHFGRSYIFEVSEDGVCHCTYEWCAAGLSPFSTEVATMSQEQLARCRLCFHIDGSYVLGSHDNHVFEKSHAYPPLSGILARLQYAFLSNGRFQGFIGFDRYEYRSPLAATDYSALQGVAQMLDVFLAEKHATDKLVESGLMLEAVADSLRSCTYIIDPETHELQFVNQNTRRIIPEALPGTLCYETIRGRSAPCDDCPIGKMFTEGTREYQTEMFLDRYELWAKIHATLIKLADGRDYGLFNGYDFAEYKKQGGSFQVDVNAFTRDTTLYDALSLSTDDYIFMCDVPKNLFYFPQAMVEEFNLPGQIIENAIEIWGAHIHENERAQFFQDIENMFCGKTNLHNQEYRVQNKDGVWVWMRCRGYLERDKDGNPSLFAGVITNLGRQSKIDSLSGMPNKYEFELQTRSTLTEPLSCGTLLLLGLDNFKYINNLYGWKFGDQVLQEAAQRMQALLPTHAQLYRLDGDTFGVFFPGEDYEAANAYYILIYEAFQHQQLSKGKRYRCTVSGGCAAFRGVTPSFHALFKQAEYALEYSKNEGKNRLSLYDDELMSDKERKLALLSLLQESVDNGCQGFELHYQPQIEPLSRKVVSAEALLRWRSAELGAVPPSEFIPLLEQTGLIHKVGRWVLSRAFETCRAWRALRPSFTINVNLSFAQLQDQTFLPDLAALVASGELEPAAIHLEMTESCIADGSRSLTEAFETLRRLGFCIEMDDFGTGYSSLEILKNAPADVVKIDHAFVRDITRSDFDATFIKFVVSLCHSVGIRVCLEGVETWAEYHMVEPMQLDLIQGYLFGRPQSRTDFEAHFLS